MPGFKALERSVAKSKEIVHPLLAKVTSAAKLGVLKPCLRVDGGRLPRKYKTVPRPTTAVAERHPCTMPYIYRP